MLQAWVIFLFAVAYLGLLFAIAFYGDKRADKGRSLINNPYIYALSIGVYCTSWTYYGSVGRAATSGMDFLPIYLGPTLVFILWPFILQKIARISRDNRITSIADFIASRYGKSTWLGGIVTVVAVFGILPYIALQLKAISTSFTVLLQYPEIIMPQELGKVSIFRDTAFFVAMLMSIFTILFGTRHIDASEHHEGMVLAIAFESVVKLFAFLAIGLYVTFGLYDGFVDLFAKGNDVPHVAQLYQHLGAGGYAEWMTLLILSMAAVICLPRQFQVAVVENVDASHVRKAAWLFPAYLLLINIFVLPIAIGGLLQFPDRGVDADTFVLTIAMANHQEGLALFAFISGLSAATGMIIVATIALSTMVCNDLVMPVLLRVSWFQERLKGDVTRPLLGIRRTSILMILMLAYGYVYFIGDSYALVTIGLVSFAAAAQFAPALVGGIFWKGGTRNGAITGIVLGTLVWLYTLVLPSFARSGWLPIDFVKHGPWGIEFLRPYALFGIEGMHHLSHALFWSIFANAGGYVWVSLLGRPSDIERLQANVFVDALQQTGHRVGGTWHGSATAGELKQVLSRFLGTSRAESDFAEYVGHHGEALKANHQADAGMMDFTERQLAGAIGAASARATLATVTKGEMVGAEDLMKILDETTQVIEYSHQLEQKSRELEITTEELRSANERLQELDRLKDSFLSVVGHEFRTPLTSIRAFGEILFDNPDLEEAQREQFYSVIIDESERLTRLIDQLLDLSKMEAGRTVWNITEVDVKATIETALAATSPLLQASNLTLEVQFPNSLSKVQADADRLIQVLMNLLSNAAKFCDHKGSQVCVSAETLGDDIRVSVADNGPGIPAHLRERVFNKFQQVGNDTLTDKPKGTGLGLAICREIIEHFGGAIWVESNEGQGSVFRFTLPLRGADT